MKNAFIILLLLSSISVFSQNILSGIITDKETGDQLPNVYIYISELHKTAVSDSSGHFEFKNIPNGVFTFQFSFIGYQTYIERITFESQDQQLNIALQTAFIESQEVIISAGASSSQHENAIKVESIKASKLAEQGGLSLMENLAKEPGMAVISKGQGVITPVIRGLSTTNILVLNNDIRMENFQFSENHPFMIDEAGIDRVEIIKGPASLLYGSDAIGGVINVIKEKPAPVRKTMGDINIKYFGNTAGITSNIGIKGSGNSLFWGLRAEQKSHRDYKQGGGNYVPNSRFNGQSAHIFAGANHNFASFKIFYDYDQTKLGLVIPPAIQLATAGERKNSDWYQDLSNHMLISKNKFFLNTWQLDANFSFQNNHRLLKANHELVPFILTDMLLNSYTYEVKAKWSNSEKQSLIFAYSGMHQHNANGNAPAHVLPDYTLTDNSLFALFQRDIGKAFHTQFGLRFDFRMIDIPDQNKSNQGQDMLESLQRNYSNISGSLGFTYDISQQLLLRINFASAYRSPNIAELSQDGMHGNRYEQGNRDLLSQRNYEVDLSTHYHINSFKFDLAIFYNYIHHYIFLEPTMDTLSTGASIYKYNQSDSKLTGIESGFEYLPWKYLNIKISFSHVLGIQDNGDYLPFIPQDKLFIALRLKKKKIGFLLDSYFEVNSDIVFKQDSPSPSETQTAPYQLLNLSLGSMIPIFNQNIKWQISVQNLLDQSYYDHLSTLKPMGFYNMGRSVNFSLKIPFG